MEDKPINIVDALTGYLGTKIMVKEKLNDPELSEARINVCKTMCPFYLKEINFCGICKCNCSSKSKSKTSYNDLFNNELEETHCPNGVWPIRLEDGTIGSSDEAIANHYLVLRGKGILDPDRIKFIN